MDISPQAALSAFTTGNKGIASQAVSEPAARRNATFVPEEQKFKPTLSNRPTTPSK